MPALAITTSRFVIEWVVFRVSMAVWAEVGDEESMAMRMRVLPSPLGRELSWVAVEGSRTAAMTVLFGRER